MAVILVSLVGVIVLLVQTIGREWTALNQDLAGVRHSAVIGFVNINPTSSMVQKPMEWFRDEEDSTLIWSGWVDGVGHTWFRVGKGEIDPSRLVAMPHGGRDIIRAIDVPVVEVGGGLRWDRLPDDTLVAGLDLGPTATAYPLKLMEKVAVVNDTIDERPLLILFTPFLPPEQSITIYEPVLDGQRITLGMSGYFQDRRPVLYDRGTESLWTVEDDGLTAVAGARKGTRLPRLAPPQIATWRDWRDGHPTCRLVVGAERPDHLPEH